MEDDSWTEQKLQGMYDSAPSPSCYSIQDTGPLCEEAEVQENVLGASMNVSTK